MHRFKDKLADIDIKIIKVDRDTFLHVKINIMLVLQ